MDSNGYWNLTQTNIDSICEPIYEAQGADVFNLCQNAASTSDDLALVTEYANKLKSGYTKDFKTFSRNKNLGQAGTTLLTSTLHNLFGTNPATTSNTASAYQTQLQADEEKKKAKKKIIIGVSVAVVLIGTGIFIYYKMKKK